MLAVIHQFSLIASLSYTAETFHPVPEPPGCPLFHQGREVLVKDREQLVRTGAAEARGGPVEGSLKNDSLLEHELCRLAQMSKALIWLGRESGPDCSYQKMT